MTIHGVDVASPYQQGWTPNSLGSGSDDFVFVKATEGTTYRNPDRADQAKAGRDKGLQIGFYHWLTPGNISAQVDYFLANAPMQAGDLLVCDWEQSGNTTAGKDEWIRGVQQAAPGHKVGLYCNTNWWTTVDTSGFFGDFLWVAAYQSNKPDLKADITFWQYTNTPIDQNHGYFADRDSLKAWAGSGGGGGTTTVEQDPTEGSIQTPYGQQGTAWASGYHQGDDWHRDAGADEVGDPIWAVASGKIIYAGDARADGGQGWGSAFGIHVLNQWDDHGRTSIDAHMSKLHVKTGDRVNVGDLIGEKGATGNVSGPHDHHEQHTGTGWSDPDVKPIYPGKPTTGGGGSTGKDDLDMSKHVKYTAKNQRGFGKADTYQWVRITDDSAVSFATKPSKIIGGLLYLEVSGFGEADSLNVYAGSYDVNKTKDTWTPVSENHPDRFQGVPGGWWHRSVPFCWNLGDQAKGFDYRALRFMIKCSTTKAKIETVRAEAWVVEL